MKQAMELSSDTVDFPCGGNTAISPPQTHHHLAIVGFDSQRSPWGLGYLRGSNTLHK